jgi:hypothetical protein
MKQYKNLWKDIVTFDNFKLAYKNATKGKKHYKEVKFIERRGVNKYLRKLLAEVIDKTYKVSDYDVFTLFTGEKYREIYRLPMKDRIVQHALMTIIEPIFRETFIVDTYSSIKYKGIHFGLNRVKKALRTNEYNYYLKLDIHKCYPSLDKDILKNKLSYKFKDNDLLWLLYTIVDSCEHGVPIGNYTSQYFNNFYFSDFDHWIKETKGMKGYFRYCDDMVILAKTKEELHTIFKEIKVKIAELNVKLKDNYQIYNIDTKGVDFLGYIIRKDYIKIRKKTKHNFINKIKNMDFSNLSSKDINILGSYWGIFVHANCRYLWLKYTGVQNFDDLDIKVHDRDFVKEVIDIPLTITNSVVYTKRGQEYLRFECNYHKNGKDGKPELHENVYISTTGEMLVEAGKQFNSRSYPFTTTIIVTDKGFYKFT